MQRFTARLEFLRRGLAVSRAFRVEGKLKVTDRTDVEITDKLASMIWRTYGLAQAFEAMGGNKPKSQLPGFGYAMALVEKELADFRANMSGEVYRAAARAGHDVGKASAIYTDIKNGKASVQIAFADLVDEAEA